MNHKLECVILILQVLQKKEGYEQIAAIFTETADQEKEHAKRMFKWLEGGMVEITASYPAGMIGTTMENTESRCCRRK